MASMLELADRRIAYHHRPGTTPGVVFCGGYTSDMTGTKARALEDFCGQRGWGYTRFDYSGHGESDGRFEAGTIGAWAEDAVAILDHVAEGPQIMVGSSMGGWIMLLVALARPERIHGLVGIAPAPDFTEDLLLPRATAEQRQALRKQGQWLQNSPYGETPYPVTAKLIEEAKRHLVLRQPIPITCPVHLLHGQRDPDVPWQTSLALAEKLQSEAVIVELIKSGDHRLSTDADIARICAAIAAKVTD